MERKWTAEEVVHELEAIIEQVPEDALFAEEVIDLIRERVAELQRTAR